MKSPASASGSSEQPVFVRQHAPWARWILSLTLAGWATLGTASAQSPPELTFSIDFSGPTIQVPGNAVGTAITDADLLVRRGGLFSPESPLISFTGSFLDRYQACQNHVPGDACGLEINAISFGRDARLQLLMDYRYHVLFSVDEFAVGRPAPVGFPFTDVFRQAQAQEAASDLFLSTFIGPVQGGPRPNFGYADGNGQAFQPQTPRLFGLGLVEPIPPSLGTVEPGDNLDAVNYGAAFDPTQDTLYFSLEGGFARCNELGASFDAAAGQTLAGTGVAAQAADVLLFGPSSGGVLAYARAQQLGLDLGGVGTDDIDALMVFENGTPGYQPPSNFYDWDSTLGSDLILFSVRCGSGVIGRIDPVSGRAIGEGDVLIKLASTGAQLPPQVFIPAEALGLRSIEGGDQENDELNGLDIFDDDEDPFLDCNMNGIDDAIDISYMNSDDIDNNGIPDECEDDWSPFCDCTLAANAPCGNTSTAGRGCANVTGVGAKIDGSGTTSITSDALTLEVSGLLPGTFGVGFAGLNVTSIPRQNGRLCVVPSGSRLGVGQADSSGVLTRGPGLIGAYPSAFPVVAGSTLFFQVYYRDNAGPCGGDGNYSNALSVTFTP